MQLEVLQVLTGMVLEAIARIVWFAQLLGGLLYLGFQCLGQDLNSLQVIQICYNCDRSRKCTLKTKYDILSKRGRIQSLRNPFRD